MSSGFYKEGYVGGGIWRHGRGVPGPESATAGEAKDVAMNYVSKVRGLSAMGENGKTPDANVVFGTHPRGEIMSQVKEVRGFSSNGRIK